METYPDFLHLYGFNQQEQQDLLLLEEVLLHAGAAHATEVATTTSGVNVVCIHKYPKLPRELVDTGFIGVSAQPLQLIDYKWAMENHALGVFHLPVQSKEFLNCFQALLKPLSSVANKPGFAVIAGHGGAGCSTFAARLASAFSQHKTSVTVIDAASPGGGLEQLFKATNISGLRWQDTSQAQGFDAQALRDWLPKIGYIRLLIGDRVEVPLLQQHNVLENLLQLEHSFVIDLGYSWQQLHVLSQQAWLKAAHTRVLLLSSLHSQQLESTRIRFNQLCELGLKPQLLLRIEPGVSNLNFGRIKIPIAGWFQSDPLRFRPFFERSFRRHNADALCKRLVSQALQWQ